MSSRLANVWELVDWRGQPVLVVMAETPEDAFRIARLESISRKPELEMRERPRREVDDLDGPVTGKLVGPDQFLTYRGHVITGGQLRRWMQRDLEEQGAAPTVDGRVVVSAAQVERWEWIERIAKVVAGHSWVYGGGDALTKSAAMDQLREALRCGQVDKN